MSSVCLFKEDLNFLLERHVLAFAIGEKRAVLTLNGYDFIRLDRQNPTHCGIVTCTYNPDYIELAVCIHDVLTANPDLTTKLVRVYRPQR